jgi:hypothetical protein
MSNGAVLVKGGKNVMLQRHLMATPTYTAPTKFGIGTGTTTPLEADTALTTKISAWSGGSDYKTVLAGYPTFNESSKKSTVRCYVMSTEANGNTITEAGLFNTDGTPKLCDHHVFTGVVKNSSTELLIEIEYVFS